VNVMNMINIHEFGRSPRPVGIAPGRYTSNLQAALTNPYIRRAVTTMPAEQFGKGMVRGYGRGVDAATLQQGQMVRGILPVVPTRASLMPGNRLARPSAIPSRAFNNTRFYSKSPVPARPESFNQRAAQIQQMVRQNPLGTSNYGARPGANSMGRFGNAGGASTGGFGNASRPGYANPRPMTPSTQGQAGNSGWRRFGPRAPSSSPAQGGQSPRGFSNGAPYSTTRPQPGTSGRSFPSRPAAPQQRTNQGGWQGFPRQSQPAPSIRGGGWNAPAPRSQSSAPNWGRSSYGSGARPYGGYGSRPSLNMNKPIVVQRPTAPRAYGGWGGGRGYSAPSGGGRGYSAPTGGGRGYSGGGHSAPSAPHGGGGGGGGGHSGGGGGSHGRR